MNELSLNDIAERVVDAVLEERFLNKKSLTKTIRPILKIWFNKSSKHKKPSNKPTDKLLETIEVRGLERVYWRKKVEEIVGADNMRPFYDEINSKVEEFKGN
jgi:hypothetical protein